MRGVLPTVRQRAGHGHGRRDGGGCPKRTVACSAGQPLEAVVPYTRLASGVPALWANVGLIPIGDDPGGRQATQREASEHCSRARDFGRGVGALGRYRVWK